MKNKICSLIRRYYSAKKTFESTLKKYNKAKSAARLQLKLQNQTKSFADKYCKDNNYSGIKEACKFYNRNEIPLTMMPKNLLRKKEMQDCKKYKAAVKDAQKTVNKILTEILNTFKSFEVKN